MTYTMTSNILTMVQWEKGSGVRRTSTRRRRTGLTYVLEALLWRLRLRNVACLVVVDDTGGRQRSRQDFSTRSVRSGKVPDGIVRGNRRHRFHGLS